MTVYVRFFFILLVHFICIISKDFFIEVRLFRLFFLLHHHPGQESDYVQWLAHSDDISDPNDGCMMGYKERLLRLRKDSVCWNGRDYTVNKQHTPCPCTLDDFLW